VTPPLAGRELAFAEPDARSQIHFPFINARRAVMLTRLHLISCNLESQLLVVRHNRNK